MNVCIIHLAWVMETWMYSQHKYQIHIMNDAVMDGMYTPSRGSGDTQLQQTVTNASPG